MSVALYDYQRKGRDFLASTARAYLADDAGLGKTVQALSAMDLVGAACKFWVVCCPASVALNWIGEASKVLSPGGWQFRLVESPGDIPDPLLYGHIGNLMLVLTYGRISTRKDIVEEVRALAQRAPVGLVLDEAHFLKSLDASRTKALLDLKGLQGLCWYVWCLSATPMPNNVVELYPAIRALVPDALVIGGGRAMSQHEFMDYFTHWSMGTYGPRIHRNRADRMKLLKRSLAGTFLRRKKSEVLSELPPIQWASLGVSCTPEGLQAMDLLDKHIRPEDVLDQNLVRDLLANPHISEALHTLGRLKAAGVCEYVVDRLDDNQDKVILFAHHQDVIAALADRLAAYNPVVIDGSKTVAQRQAAVQQFQTDPACRVFIGQNTAAGTGITLTAASEVLLVEPSWVPADNYQIASRAHRIGQSGSVVAKFVYLDPHTGLDSLVQETLRRKTQMIADLFE